MISGVVIGKKRSSKIGKKGLLIMLLAIVLISVGLYFGKNVFSHSVCNGRNSPVYRQVTNALKNNQRTELMSAGENILKSDYKSDPSCLYAVIEYSIATQNKAKAEESYGLLQRAYAKKSSFVGVYSEIGITNLEAVTKKMEQFRFIYKTVGPGINAGGFN